MRKELSKNQLQIIAIIAMTIDHLTWLFFPGTQKLWYVMALHAIGRLTAPIMWYFIAEGCYYTKNHVKYIKRLFCFALISHFAFTLAFGIPIIPFTDGVFNQTSVMFPLSIAALLIYINKKDDLSPIIKIIAIILACVAAFPADWSSIAVMVPFFLYENRGDFKKQSIIMSVFVCGYVLIYFLFLDKAYGLLQFCTLLTLPLLYRYKGSVGKLKMNKWFFYIYFPAHMAIVGILRLVIWGDIPLVF